MTTYLSFETLCFASLLFRLADWCLNFGDLHARTVLLLTLSVLILGIIGYVNGHTIDTFSIWLSSNKYTLFDLVELDPLTLATFLNFIRRAKKLGVSLNRWILRCTGVWCDDGWEFDLRAQA